MLPRCKKTHNKDGGVRMPELEEILGCLDKLEEMYCGGNSAPRRQYERIRECVERAMLREELSSLEEESGVYL